MPEFAFVPNGKADITLGYQGRFDPRPEPLYESVDMVWLKTWVDFFTNSGVGDKPLTGLIGRCFLSPTIPCDQLCWPGRNWADGGGFAITPVNAPHVHLNVIICAPIFSHGELECWYCVGNIEFTHDEAAGAPVAPLTPRPPTRPMSSYSELSYEAAMALNDSEE